MGSENNNLDLENTSLSTEVTGGNRLSSNPVSEFEENKRTLLQKSLANANDMLSMRPGKRSEIPESIQTFTAPQRQLPQTQVKEVQQKHEVQQKPVAATQEEEELIKTGWGKISTGVLGFFSASGRLGKKAHEVDSKSIVAFFGKAAAALVYAVGNGVEYVFHNPTKVWEFAKNTAGIVIDVAKGVAVAVATEAYNMITHPIDTIKRFGSFLKGFSDHIGLTDMVMGVYHFGASLAYLSVGNFSEAGKHLKESTRAIAGAVTALGELTGLNDLGRAVIALSKGEYGKAAFYVAMGATQIYLIFTTLGVGNLLSKQGVEAAKQGVKILAQDTGKEVVAELEKKISNSLLEKTGAKIALVSERLILKDWKTIVVNLYTNVKELVSNTAEKIMEKLLRDHGAKQIVTKSTDKLLEKISTRRVSALAEEFAKEGIKWREAKYMAKCLKKALGKPGRFSRYHEILADEITNEIAAQIKEDFMVRGLRKGFESKWKAAASRIVKVMGLDSVSMETLLKAGSEGFEEGATEGIVKVVREGVDESLRKYRGERFFYFKRNKEEGEMTTGLIYKPVDFEVEPPRKKKQQKVMSRKKKPEEEDSSFHDAEGNLKHEKREKAENKFLEVG